MSRNKPSPWRAVFEETAKAAHGRRDEVATIGSINWLRHAMERRGANPNVVRNIIYRDKGRLHDKRELYLILEDLRRDLGLPPISDPELTQLGTPFAAAELEVDQVLGREQRRVYRMMVGGSTGRRPPEGHRHRARRQRQDDARRLHPAGAGAPRRGRPARLPRPLPLGRARRRLRAPRGRARHARRPDGVAPRAHRLGRPLRGPGRRPGRDGAPGDGAPALRPGAEGADHPPLAGPGGAGAAGLAAAEAEHARRPAGQRRRVAVEDPAEASGRAAAHEHLRQRRRGALVGAGGDGPVRGPAAPHRPHRRGGEVVSWPRTGPTCPRTSRTRSWRALASPTRSCARSRCSPTSASTASTRTPAPRRPSSASARSSSPAPTRACGPSSPP